MIQIQKTLYCDFRNTYKKLAKKKDTKGVLSLKKDLFQTTFMTMTDDRDVWKHLHMY